MQILKIELEDSMYQNIIHSGVDIQEKVKEFLSNFVDDGYPAISTGEAKKRVSDAVERYYDSTGTYLNDKDYKAHINKTVQKLQDKYAHN